MKLYFITKLKDIFGSEAKRSYYSNLGMEIFRQNLIERAALSLNEGILPEDVLENIYGEKILVEARIFRGQMEP